MLTVRGSHNLRDLGGLRTADDQEVRRGRLFRSDYPAFVDTDVEAAAALSLQTIVDLRREDEADFELVSWVNHDVSHHLIPLSAGADSAWHADYHAYLEVRPDRVVDAVRVLMSAAHQPALFHCAAGKDRTGLIAALLLGVLGVDDEQIVADYVLTADAVVPIMSRLMLVGPYAELLADSDITTQTPVPETMQGLLGWLAARGGPTSWLLDHGITAVEIAAFRETMLLTRDSP